MTSFVYFVQAGGARGPVKIGHTRNVKQRIESLQTGSPQKLTLLGTIECADGRALEAELHAQFAAHRIDGGEWFRWSAELQTGITRELDRASKHHGPVARAVTYDWHAPRCSYCGALIAQPAQCLAGWFDDEHGNAWWPFVCHTGDLCGFYGLVGGLHRLQDLTIDTLRRAPMEAILVALRRGAADREGRTAWARWTSIVLGLPFCQFDSTLDLRLAGEVANALADHVPLASDLRALLNAAISRGGGR